MIKVKLDKVGLEIVPHLVTYCSCYHSIPCSNNHLVLNLQAPVLMNTHHLVLNLQVPARVVSKGSVLSDVQRPGDEVCPACDS